MASRMVGRNFRNRCCSECGTVIDSAEATITAGSLVMDRALRTVTWNGQLVRLTKQQFEILELLIQREGRLVQRWAFFVAVIDEEVEDKLVDTRICQIRAAFRKVDPDFDQLVTHWGEGYSWRRDNVAQAAAA